MMRAIESEDTEIAYRRGYQDGVVETFGAVEKFLDQATREAVRAWVNDVVGWRTKAMLSRPANWRLRMLGRVKGGAL